VKPALRLLDKRLRDWCAFRMLSCAIFCLVLVECVLQKHAVLWLFSTAGMGGMVCSAPAAGAAAALGVCSSPAAGAAAAVGVGGHCRSACDEAAMAGRTHVAMHNTVIICGANQVVQDAVMHAAVRQQWLLPPGHHTDADTGLLQGCLSVRLSQQFVYALSTWRSHCSRW